MISGKKITVTISMMPSVFWLEAASHRVRLLLGSVADGMTKGNIENPAVRIMPATATELKKNATNCRPARPCHKARAMPIKAATGAAIIHG